jgi:hypothetical protein
MAKEPKPHVKNHLEKRGIPVSDCTDDVIEAFNAFSKQELDVMVDKLGETLMADDKLNDHQRISAVH